MDHPFEFSAQYLVTMLQNCYKQPEMLAPW